MSNQTAVMIGTVAGVAALGAGVYFLTRPKAAEAAAAVVTLPVAKPKVPPVTAPHIIPEKPKVKAGPVSPLTDFSRFTNPGQVRRDEEHAIEVSNKLDVTQHAIDHGAPPVNGTTTTGYVIGATADPTKGYIDIGVGGKETINASVQEELAKSKKIESGEIKFDKDAAMRAFGYVKDSSGNWTPGGASSGKGPV